MVGSLFLDGCVGITGRLRVRGSSKNPEEGRAVSRWAPVVADGHHALYVARQPRLPGRGLAPGTLSAHAPQEPASGRRALAGNVRHAGPVTSLAIRDHDLDVRCATTGLILSGGAARVLRKWATGQPLLQVGSQSASHVQRRPRRSALIVQAIWTCIPLSVGHLRTTAQLRESSLAVVFYTVTAGRNLPALRQKQNGPEIPRSRQKPPGYPLLAWPSTFVLTGPLSPVDLLVQDSTRTLRHSWV